MVLQSCLTTFLQGGPTFGSGIFLAVEFLTIKPKHFKEF